MHVGEFGWAYVELFCLEIDKEWYERDILLTISQKLENHLQDHVVFCQEVDTKDFEARQITYKTFQR
mgnify:CR=1 FL=1|tara:strand:+ start:24134 stop:24334 length:201 start_codon:yes stop_codon:yes gene_type:complete